MATIPTYKQQIIPGNPGVQPRASAPDAGSGLMSIGNAIAGIGQAVEKNDRALKQKEEEDGRAWTALAASNDDVSEADKLEEAKSRAPAGAQGFAGEYLKEFDNRTSDLIKGAPTEAARSFYNQARADLRARSFQKARTFEATQGIQWREQQWDQAIDNVSAIAARDPESAKLAAAKLDIILKDSPYQAQAAQKREKLQALVSRSAVAGLIERNPAEAARQLDQYFGIGAADAKSMTQASPDDLYAAVIQQESGGRHTLPGGALLTSSAGAKGISQVMPTTGTDPGYGVKPLQDQSKAEYLRFGRDYLNAMLKEFGGDRAKALAAYNAGPGAVQAAVKASPDNWLSSLPQETQNYVSTISRRTAGPMLASTDSTAALEAIDNKPRQTGNQFVDFLDPQTAWTLRNRAQTEVQRGQSLARVGIQEREKDLQSMALAGVAPPTASVPSESEYIDAFGPAEGRIRYRENVTEVARLGDGIRSLQTASGQERAMILAASTPQPGTGFDDQQRRSNALQQANKIIEKQLIDDPASYVSKNAPKVQSAYQTMISALSDPTVSEADRQRATENYAQLTLAEQQRMGVQNLRDDTAGDAGSRRQPVPRILTNAQANGIAQQFNSSSANAAQLMDGLQKQWGRFFPQVYGQLAQDNKLPDAAMVIPNMSDAYAKENLARWSDPEATKALKERMQPGDSKALNSKLLEQNEGFFGSLAYQQGGQKTYSSVVDQQRILAMGYMSQGKSVGDAARLAFEQTVGHAYEFNDTLRIPKAQQPTEVMAGTRVLLNSADKMDMAVPPSFRPGLKANDRRAAWVDALRNGATFVTNGDESGINLYVRAKNEAGVDALFAVRDSDGANPLSWSWSQLRSMYSEQPDAASSDTALNQAIIKRDKASFDQIQRDRAQARYRMYQGQENR